MANNNIYYIKGREITHSMYFGSSISKNEVECIGGISDYMLSTFDKRNNNKQGVEVSPTFNLTTKEISICTTFLLVSEYRLATPSEIEMFTNALAEKNLVYEHRTLSRWNFYGEQTFDYLTTYYINKDNMLIKIGENTITYNELKDMHFDENDKVILSGDNGYSHCWASTTKVSHIFKMIDDLFEKPTERKGGVETRTQNRAFYGTHMGWKFGDVGELVLKITKKDVNFSEVSNS